MTLYTGFISAGHTYSCVGQHDVTVNAGRSLQ